LNSWLLLIYKIPREPSVHRVSIWRKLKQLGAVLLQDAIWVLPATPHTREQFQWLASEIDELGGETTFFVAELDGQAKNSQLVKIFLGNVDAAYKEILTQLKRKNPDLTALARKYQLARSQDHFQSKLADKVRKALLAKGEKSS
jgi:DNA-binding transcriptional regulator PaaX